MIKKRMRRAITRNLTPEKAWDEYVSLSPEFFISNFFTERVPVTDLKEMCRINVSEIPDFFDGTNILFTDSQLDLIENLTFQYLENYVEEKGGIDKLDLFTEEELDIIFEREAQNVLDLLADYLGHPRKLVYKPRKN